MDWHLVAPVTLDSAVVDAAVPTSRSNGAPTGPAPPPVRFRRHRRFHPRTYCYLGHTPKTTSLQPLLRWPPLPPLPPPSVPRPMLPPSRRCSYLPMLREAAKPRPLTTNQVSKRTSLRAVLLHDIVIIPVTSSNNNYIKIPIQIIVRFIVTIHDFLLWEVRQLGMLRTKSTTNPSMVDAV